MTEINARSASPIHSSTQLQSKQPQLEDSFPGLPSPLLAGSEPTDALGMMMMAMERMAQQSIDQKQLEIKNVQNKLDDAMDELMDQLAEVVEKAAKAAKEDSDGGWFSRFVDDVVDVVAGAIGKVVGTVIDYVEDLAMMPSDLIVGVAKNFRNPEMWGQILKDELKQLVTNGDTAKKFEGAVKGVVKFAVDVLEFSQSFLAVLEAGLSGENIMDALGDQARGLWNSVTDNLIDNPDFMAVIGDVAKAVAIASTAVSGGTLGPIAVGLIVLAELDAKHGIANEVFGEKAGPWVSMGVQLAATVMTTVATMGADSVLKGGELLDTLQAGTALVGISSQVYTGVKTIRQANEDAAHIESQAELLKTTNRIAQLQRLMTELLGEFEEKSEMRTDAYESGSHLQGLAASTNQAAIFRA